MARMLLLFGRTKTMMVNFLPSITHQMHKQSSPTTPLEQCSVLYWPLSASERPGFAVGWTKKADAPRQPAAVVVVAGILDDESFANAAQVQDVLTRIKQNQCERASFHGVDAGIWESLELLAWYEPRDDPRDDPRVPSTNDGGTVSLATIRAIGRAGNNRIPYVQGWLDESSRSTSSSSSRSVLRQVVYYDDSGRTCYHQQDEPTISSGNSQTVLEYLSLAQTVMYMFVEKDNLSSLGAAVEKSVDLAATQSSSRFSLFLELVKRLYFGQEPFPLQVVVSLGSSLLKGNRIHQAYNSPRRKIQLSVDFWDRHLMALVNLAAGLLALLLLKPVLLGAAFPMGASLSSYIHWQSQLIQDGTQWLEKFPVGFKLNEPLTQNLGQGIRSLSTMHEALALQIADFMSNLLVRQWCFGFLSLVTLTTGAVGLLALLMDAVCLLHAQVWLFSIAFSNIFRCELFLLAVLWRVFRGKKQNILRKRTDSMQYDSIQLLLLGSILFAIALFLFTTVLIYHIFFAVCDMTVSSMLFIVYVPFVWFRTWPAGIVATSLLGAQWYSNKVYLEEHASPVASICVTTLRSEMDGAFNLAFHFSTLFASKTISLWLGRLTSALFGSPRHADALKLV